MNKVVIIAVSVLAAFVGWCGWLAAHYTGDGGDEASRCIKRVQIPLPISPEAVRTEQAMLAAAAAAADATLQINGKEIVSSRGNPLDPERHDMAHYLARINHRLLADWCPVGHKTAVDDISPINPQISKVVAELDRKLPLTTERITELHGHYKTERPEVATMRWR
jgi:hypothetical protein